MLNVVTGLPGAGKTLYTLAKRLPQFRGRQIYVYGIPGIDHEHFGTIELEDPEKWYELPEGSVVIIDEAQQIFPLRRAGTQVPKKCSKFETHRHKGFDIELLTQDATTLDVHIRKLAGGHIHVRRLFGSNTANVYTYAKYQPKPEDRNTIRAAVTNKVWTYDKTIFDHYKSADLHTVKRKIPLKLILVPVLLVAAIFMSVTAYSFVSSMFSDDAEQIKEFSQNQSFRETESAQSNTLSKAEKWIHDRTPIVEGMPWTAPVYNEVRKVAAYPQPHCIIIERNFGDECVCYTQQLSKMGDVSDDICRLISTEGWFDEAKEQQRESERVSRAAPVASSPPLRQRFNDMRATTTDDENTDPKPGRAIRGKKFTNWNDSINQ